MKNSTELWNEFYANLTTNKAMSPWYGEKTDTPLTRESIVDYLNTLSPEHQLVTQYNAFITKEHSENINIPLVYAIGGNQDTQQTFLQRKPSFSTQQQVAAEKPQTWKEKAQARVDAEYNINRYYQDRSGLVHDNWKGFNLRGSNFVLKTLDIPFAIARSIGNNGHQAMCYIGSTVNKGFKMVGGACDGLGDLCQNKANKWAKDGLNKGDPLIILAPIIHIAGTCLKAAGKTVDQVGTVFQTAFSALGNCIRAVGQTAGLSGGMGSAWAQVGGSITRTAANLCYIVTEPVKSVGESFKIAGNEMGDGYLGKMTRGIGNVINTAGVAVEGVIETVRTGVNGFFPTAGKTAAAAPLLTGGVILSIVTESDMMPIMSSTHTTGINNGNDAKPTKSTAEMAAEGVKENLQGGLDKDLNHSTAAIQTGVDLRKYGVTTEIIGGLKSDTKTISTTERLDIATNVMAAKKQEQQNGARR